MKKIPLTQGKFAIVDNCDYDYLMQWKWHYQGNNYAVRTCRVNSKRTILMHRVILERMGFKDFAHADHINKDSLNNCRCNLRPATVCQSMYNRSKMKNNTSGYIGVCWNKGSWRVAILANYKQIYVGSSHNKKEAARMYNEAALKHHGEFAVLNEVE